MTHLEWLLEIGLWSHAVIHIAEPTYEFKSYCTPRIIVLNNVPHIPFI